MQVVEFFFYLLHLCQLYVLILKVSVQSLLELLSQLLDMLVLLSFRLFLLWRLLSRLDVLGVLPTKAGCELQVADHRLSPFSHSTLLLRVCKLGTGLHILDTHSPRLNMAHSLALLLLGHKLNGVLVLVWVNETSHS